MVPLGYPMATWRLRLSLLTALTACGSSTPGASVEGDAGTDSSSLSPTDAASERDGAIATADARAGRDAAVAPPAGYNVDLTQTSVSGLSSGAFMAVQFAVAFSSTVKGVAAFAGGPFDCAQGSLANIVACMAPLAKPDPKPLVDLTKQWATQGLIDPVGAIAAQRVFVFIGASDAVVSPLVTDSVNDYFTALGAGANIRYENRRPGTGHTMPTTSYGGPCGASASPFIGNCGYDGAGEALKQIYGALTAPSAAPTGKFVQVAQGDYVAMPASHGLADTGYLYVPDSCAKGALCKIHVAFHGCQQNAGGTVGDAFYRNAGYNPWADTNGILVFYPQTIASTTPSNPSACWDWWGYDSPDYAKKSGPQMTMVKNVLDHLAGKTP